METKHDRLRKARVAAGYKSAADAARAFGWPINTYPHNENGNATFSYEKAKQYAAAFGVSAEWILEGESPMHVGVRAPPTPEFRQPGDPVNLADLRAYLSAQKEAPQPRPSSRGRVVERRIPVVGEVAAGIWREAPHREIEDVTDWLPMEVQGYERAQLRAYKVVGPSMNLIYPEGRHVIAAHPAEAGLRDGDHVVVERMQGPLSEITLKEFVVDDDGRIALWPRSSHPDFQTPLYFKPTEEQEQVGLTIIGVVVGDFSKRNRPPLPFTRA